MPDWWSSNKSHPLYSRMQQKKLKKYLLNMTFLHFPIQDCASLRDRMNQRCRAHGLEVPLKTKVVPSHVVAHQAFAVRLTSWLVGMFARCSGFRALFAEVFLSVRDTKFSFMAVSVLLCLRRVCPDLGSQDTPFYSLNSILFLLRICVCGNQFPRPFSDRRLLHHRAPRPQDHRPRPHPLVHPPLPLR